MGAPAVEWLTIAGAADAWRSIGLTVGGDGEIALFGPGVRIVPPTDGAAGIVGWALSGIDPIDAISTLPTEVVDPVPPSYADHPLGAHELDHVVVLTTSIETTSAAITAATGCPLKRVRQVGTIRQGFHRIGPRGLIVELVERTAAPAPDELGESFWGLVFNVEDLDAAYDRLGPDLMSAPQDAVQPGRRIATVRSDVGLGTAVALMTRDPR